MNTGNNKELIAPVLDISAEVQSRFAIMNLEK